MKLFPRSVSTVIIALAAALLLTTAPKAGASAEGQMDRAQAASKAWVSQIDAGKYEDSYSFACGAMRDKVKEDRWVLILKSLRSPWGAVVSRKQLSHVYKAEGVPGLNGECAVLKYETSFQHFSPVIETVVLKWEDGKWLGAGYNAGPKPTDNDQTAAANQGPVTETQTNPHAKAPPPDQQ